MVFSYLTYTKLDIVYGVRIVSYGKTISFTLGTLTSNL